MIQSLNLRPLQQIHFSQLDSTNSWLKEHGKQWPEFTTGVSTTWQTKGRGRYQRKWDQKPGLDLAMSMGFKVDQVVGERLGQLPLFVASQLLLELNHLLKPFDFDIKIKWPNDLLVNGKKLAGILCEALWQNDTVYFIIGIGVNVLSTKADFEEAQYQATSLLIETHKPVKVHWLSQQILTRLWQNTPVFLYEGLTPYIHLLNDHLFQRNTEVELEWVQPKQTETLKGRVQQIDINGNLVIELPDQKTRSFSFGEVNFKKANI